MAYEKLNLEKGQVLEAEHMAHIEDGISKAAVVYDVLELPAENIDESAFYRIPKGTFVTNLVEMDAKVYVVEGLPETGDPVTMDGNSINAGYYNTLDNEVYGYLPSQIAIALGVPAGWYAFSMLASAFGVGWGGVIGNLLDCPTNDSICLLMEGDVWYHKYGWRTVNPIGWRGEGIMAEVFNSPLNYASGNCAHAEGVGTTASGKYSHAEGDYTSAGGMDSHAEGGGTQANGRASHAEGSATVATGDYSHAEGYRTAASSDYQHAQGRWNIVDLDGQYAHIVGNGEENARSNAHTLDWDGNAWFAGGIELTSPNGTRYRFTVSDDGSLSATAI